VRVGDRGQFEELVDAAAALLVLALELDRDAGAGRVLGRAGTRPRGELACRREFSSRSRCGGKSSVSSSTVTSARLVLVFIASSMWCAGLLASGLGLDHHRLAGGDQAVHAGGGDADALLAARHLEAVELAAVEQAAEDVLDLLADDARAVVDDGDAVARCFLALAGRRAAGPR
jgi:hypothetical protein